MSIEISTTFANRSIDWLLNTGSPTRPSTVYFALGTGSGATGLTGEPSGNGYARQAITFNAASARSASNASEITFGPCTTTNWGTMSHGGLYDADADGNCIASGSLDTARTVTVGDTATLAAGALTFAVGAYSD